MIAYLPPGYKKSSLTRTEGRARTGEVARQGLVSHTEHWDGRVSANVQRSTIRYVREPDGTIRAMTFKEMVAKGYFIPGRGPSGL
jgi:hypothetical protein